MQSVLTQKTSVGGREIFQPLQGSGSQAVAGGAITMPSSLLSDAVWGSVFGCYPLAAFKRLEFLNPQGTKRW